MHIFTFRKCVGIWVYVYVHMGTYRYTHMGLVDSSSSVLPEREVLCTWALFPSRCPWPWAYRSSKKLNDFTQGRLLKLKVMQEKYYWPNLNLYVQAILWTIYESSIHSDLIISKVPTRPDRAWVTNCSVFLQLKLTCFGLLYICHLLCSNPFFCSLHALWYLLCLGPSNSFLGKS